MTLQERFNTFETQARGRIRQALSTSNEKLLEIDKALARVTKDDWTVPGLRRHLEELRARAETLRTSARKRVEQLPGEAVSRLASGARTPIQNLSKSLAEMASRIERRPRPVETKSDEAKPSEPKIAKVS